VLISDPTNLRFSIIAAMPVVPAPINGSNTVPLIGVSALINLGAEVAKN